MRTQWATSFLLLTLSGLAAAEADSGCQAFYTRNDPRLFDFVDTRKSIDYSAFDGMTIGEIEPVVLPIFNENDPDESNRLYRLINTLHIDTRPFTISRQLTLESGKPLKAKLVAENERLLRENDYLADAMLVPRRACGDEVDLLAVVRDIWTLTPSTSFSRTGGENKSSVGISESNLLGTGQSLALGYFRNDDRSGYSVSYGHDQLFSNHTELDLTYSETSDGSVKEAGIARPFYSLNTPWSYGVYALQEDRIDDIDTAQERLNTFKTEIELYEVYGGWSRGLIDNVSQRWTVGITESSTVYTDLPDSAIDPPEDRQLRYPWMGWEYIEDRFWTTTNINQIGRQEDIRLGAYWSTRMGYASENWGSSEDAVLYSLQHQYTLSVGRHHIMQFYAGIDGRYNTNTDKAKSTFANFETRYFHFIDQKNRWYARLRLDAGRNIEQNEQLTSGGNDNLRGYPNDTQRGNQRWLLTVERRHFTDWHIFNLFRVGAVAYIDVGRTRDTETPQINNTTNLANVGFGLRFSSSKAGKDKVVHLDIAVPLRERYNIDSYQILATGKSAF
ncbi:hypothetical protein FHR99_001080 [Litorivivens lipolytica]|uniref:Bacterial surface antigen (D15) domain-containing protein n=1 Tax=Litorivivens lipolytica TaxID=1524264 RepID=A0A7W4W4P8_9GAMM|nr:hypothetical protein [Litorivivens lipolytica]MBB3046844.1 hypothetical protein [Litorivivens lipolytica]